MQGSDAEQGNRRSFHNAATHPDAAAEPVYQPMCAERAPPGHPAFAGIVAAIVARIPAERVTDDSDLHPIAGAVRIDPVAHDRAGACFRLPVPRTLHLASRVAGPQRIGIGGDTRRLGLFLHRLRIDGTLMRAIDGSRADLHDGFHPAEGTSRWTQGAALIPPALYAVKTGEITVTVEGRGFERYVAREAA